MKNYRYVYGDASSLIGLLICVVGLIFSNTAIVIFGASLMICGELMGIQQAIERSKQ